MRSKNKTNDLITVMSESEHRHCDLDEGNYLSCH